MSKYSGVYDFRDCLQILFDDDFDQFLKYTNGWVVFNDNTSIQFKSPEELIEYYPYAVSALGYTKGESCKIQLSNRSYIDEKEEEYSKINKKYSVPPFSMEWISYRRNLLKDAHDIAVKYKELEQSSVHRRII